MLACAPPATADVLSEMNRFWQGAAVNTTGPTAFQGQASGHWTLGNLYLRAPVRAEPIATVNLPSFRAGCGGIDAFAGAFSFINSDQLVAFARAIAQNAAGFAFELALETISPVIAETMSKLRALAQWANNRNVNSCETAQALVGAVWSRNDRASAAICAAIGTSQGIFTDYAAARHGCGADGQRHSTLGRGLWRDGRSGARQRELRLEGRAGIVVPGRRHPACRVRDVGLGDGDRDRAHRTTATRRVRGSASSSRSPSTGGSRRS